MFEDILRAAQKANGETLGEPPKPKYEPPKPKYDEPTKWYEKKWGVALALIICFPIGAILLWQNPRYSNQIKGGVTAGIIFLFLFYRFSFNEPSPSPDYRHESAYTQSNGYDDSQFTTYQGSYGDVGYLKQDVQWLDGNGDFHHNSRKVKVEIGKQKIEALDGKLTQIYFLEGKNAGMWGYVSEYSLER